MKEVTKKLLDSGYWILDTGCWMLDKIEHRASSIEHRGPNFLTRILSLLVAELFLFSSILPVWATPLPTPSHLRPTDAKDGGISKDLLKEFQPEAARDGGGRRALSYTKGLLEAQGFSNLLANVERDIEGGVERAGKLPPHPFYSPDYFKARIRFDIEEGLNIIARKGRLDEFSKGYLARDQNTSFLDAYTNDHPFVTWLIQSGDGNLVRLARLLQLFYLLSHPPTERFAYLNEMDYLPEWENLRDNPRLRDYWVGAEREASENLLVFAKELYGAHGIPMSEALRTAVRRRFHEFLDRYEEWPALGIDTPHGLVEGYHQILEKYLGIRDPAAAQKDQADRDAKKLFSEIWARVLERRTPEEKLSWTLAGTFVGNRFDLGAPDFKAGEAAQFLDGIVKNFAVQVQAVAEDSHALYLDNRSDFLQKINELKRKRGIVVIAFDNAGPDFILGVLPFAMVLARDFNLQVRLAGNENPASNDKTWYEAGEDLEDLAKENRDLSSLVKQGSIQIISTGNGSQRIDLRRVSDAFNQDADLFIFQGQGRGIESARRFTDDSKRETRFVRFSKPVVFLATIKDPFTSQGMAWEAGKTEDPERYVGVFAYRDTSILHEGAEGEARDGGWRKGRVPALTPAQLEWIERLPQALQMIFVEYRDFLTTVSAHPNLLNPKSRGTLSFVTDVRGMLGLPEKRNLHKDALRLRERYGEIMGAQLADLLLHVHNLGGTTPLKGEALHATRKESAEAILKGLRSLIDTEIRLAEQRLRTAHDGDEHLRSDFASDGGAKDGADRAVKALDHTLRETVQGLPWLRDYGIDFEDPTTYFAVHLEANAQRSSLPPVMTHLLNEVKPAANILRRARVHLFSIPIDIPKGSPRQVRELFETILRHPKILVVTVGNPYQTALGRWVDEQHFSNKLVRSTNLIFIMRDKEGKAIHTLGVNTYGESWTEEYRTHWGRRGDRAGSLIGKRVVILGGWREWGESLTISILESLPKSVTISEHPDRVWMPQSDFKIAERQLKLNPRIPTLTIVPSFDPKKPQKDHPKLLAALREADIIINATEIGADGKSSPIHDPTVFEHPVEVFDILYQTAEGKSLGLTPFLSQAEARGARVGNGVGLFIRNFVEQSRFLFSYLHHLTPHRRDIGTGQEVYSQFHRGEKNIYETLYGYAQTVEGLHDVSPEVAPLNFLNEGQRLANFPDSDLSVFQMKGDPQGILAAFLKVWPDAADNVIVFDWVTLPSGGYVARVAPSIYKRIHEGGGVFFRDAEFWIFRDLPEHGARLRGTMGGNPGDPWGLVRIDPPIEIKNFLQTKWLLEREEPLIGTNPFPFEGAVDFDEEYKKGHRKPDKEPPPMTPEQIDKLLADEWISAIRILSQAVNGKKELIVVKGMRRVLASTYGINLPKRLTLSEGVGIINAQIPQKGQAKDGGIKRFETPTRWILELFSFP